MSVGKTVYNKQTDRLWREFFVYRRSKTLKGLATSAFVAELHIRVQPSVNIHLA